MTDTNNSKAKILEFPGAPGQIVSPADKPPQGAVEFYQSVGNALGLAIQVATPVKGKHPAIDSAFGEILRYLELATMYMDRLCLYSVNPNLLKNQENKNAPAQKN